MNALSQSELEILKLVIEGKTNKEISIIKYVSVHTVKYNLTNIYQKLQVSNRVQASIYALNNGIV